jgi:hypothetical protein
MALRAFWSDIADAAKDTEQRSRARQMLSTAVERIELDPQTLACRLQDAVATGDNLASPRGFEPL